VVGDLAAMKVRVHWIVHARLDPELMDASAVVLDPSGEWVERQPQRYLELPSASANSFVCCHHRALSSHSRA